MTSATLRRSATMIGGFFLFSFASVLSARELPLRNELLAHTENGRQLLKYMVSCALTENDNVAVTVEGNKYVFPGVLGWVPDWANRPMTEPEKRRLSSCLAAHTNFFQKQVRLSLRSDDPAAPTTVQTTAAEQKNYPFFEGGFFGNYFISDPVSYVCLGDSSGQRNQHLENLFRVCSLAKEGESTISRCDFKIVVFCKDKPFMQNGVDYSKEVLWVYLPGPTTSGK